MPAVIKIQIDGVNSADNAFQGAQRGLRDLDRAARDSGGGFSALKEVGIGALREVGAMAAQVGVQAAQDIGAFVADSVSAAGDFEASVNGLAAVAGDALTQAGFSFDDVSAKALQLGQDTQFSAQEAIQAMTELVKGGVPIQGVMTDATDATLALASATGVDLTNAAEIVAKQLGVWSETGVTAAEVTDLLASAANASTVGVDDLAIGLANAGGTAKTAGVEFSDLVQTMALIAPNFSSASDAGTSLKTFLSRLIPTTENAKAAMQELGLMFTNTTKIAEFLSGQGIAPLGDDLDTLGNQFTEFAAAQGWTAKEIGNVWSSFSQSSFFDMEGSFVGMEEAARLLQTATADLSEEEKLLAFNTIFGSDAIRAAAAIANAGAEGFNTMGQAMADSGGAAAAAALKNQGFNFAMEQLRGSIETVQIVLGSKLLPLLTPLVQQFTEGVNVAMTFAQALFGDAEAAASLTPPMQALLTTVQGWIAQAQAAAPQAQAMAQQFLTALMPALAGAGVAFQSLMAVVQSVMPSILGIIQSTLTIVQAFWQQHGATVLQITQSVWQAIQGVIQVVFGVIQGLMAIFAAAMTGDYQTMMTQIQQSNTTIWTGISNFLTGILNTIAAFFGTSLSEIKSTWESNLRNLPIVATSVMNAVIAAFERALGLAPGIGRGIIEGMANGIRSAVGGLVSAARSAVESALNAARSALKIESPSKVAANLVGMPFSQGIAEGITAGVPLIANAGAMSAGAAVAGAQSTVTNVTNTYNYSPSYGSAPASPAMDFALMQTKAQA